MYTQSIIKLLSRKAGCDVTTAPGSEYLCNDIIATTHEQLSVNTIKRITGVLSSNSGGQTKPRIATLDIIARYLGFNNYDNLKRFVDHELHSSHFRRDTRVIYAKELAPGAVLSLAWMPNRTLSICKLESGEFLVEKTINTKLKAGDILDIPQIMDSFPLFVRSVVRDGSNLGPYTAASETGIYLRRQLLNPDSFRQ